jgi:anion-transporting  ArsA/GET3 family ATPase
MPSMQRPLPLTILCGKGGVGKTTLSLALALRTALRGENALVVTSHPLQELAVSISLAGLKERYPQAREHLYVLHIDPREILSSTVRQHIPSDFLAEAVVSSRIYQSLIEIAPGLKELAFLGRLWNLAQQRAGETQERKFSLLVWDAPAMGHFLQTLQVSRNFEAHLSGPFADLGSGIREFFSSPGNFAVLPVTTLEEMAVEETVELIQTLRSKLDMEVRKVICNLSSPLLATAGEVVGADTMRQFARAAEENTKLKFILSRQQLESSLFENLQSRTATSFHVVRRQPARHTDLDLLLNVANEMEGLPTESAAS